MTSRANSSIDCMTFSCGMRSACMSEMKWSSPAYGKGSLMLADGRLLLYGERGRLGLAEASPAGFREQAGAQVMGGSSTWAPPVLSNGRIYCRSLGDLACFDVSGK